MRAVKEVNFDVSLRLFYFLDDQVAAMSQPPNAEKALKKPFCGPGNRRAS